MPTWIYNRVSTFEQALFGHSLDAQASVCIEYCRAAGLTLGQSTNCNVPGLFVDGGKSGFKTRLADRPGGSALLAVLAPGDTVVVTSLHRMFRRMTDLVNTLDRWVSNGVTVRFVDCPGLDLTSANGKAVVYMLGVMAQLKSELISARVKESFAVKRGRKSPEPKSRPVVSVTPAADVLQMINKLRAMDTRFAHDGRIIAYTRVSKHDQDADHQRRFISSRYEIQQWYVDTGESAYKAPLHKRPAGSQLLKDLRRGDTVVILRPDRMFRSLKDMANQVEAITKRGVTIVVAESGLRTDDVYGRMLFSMLSMFAELESLEISRSTKAGKFAALARSEAARQAVMTISMTSRDRSRQHAQIFYLLPLEKRCQIWAHYWMVKDHYKSREEAARAVSRTWLERLGLPPVLDKISDTSKSYLARLIASHEKSPTVLKARAIELVSKRVNVHHLLNITSLSRCHKSQQYLYEASRQVKGDRLRLMAKSCKDHREFASLAQSLQR